MVVDHTGKMGQHVSLAIDRTGARHVTCYEFLANDTRRLKYARTTAQGWQTQTIDALRCASGEPGES